MSDVLDIGCGIAGPDAGTRISGVAPVCVAPPCRSMARIPAPGLWNGTRVRAQTGAGDSCDRHLAASGPLAELESGRPKALPVDGVSHDRPDGVRG